MKKLALVFSAFFLLTAAAFGQTTSISTNHSDEIAQAATQVLVEKYGLDAAQTERMLAVQKQKQRNLTAIEPLKTTDAKKYNAKLQSVLTGSRASLRHVLRSKTQVEIFDKMLVELRDQRNAKQTELLARNASKTEIEAALLEVEKQF